MMELMSAFELRSSSQLRPARLNGQCTKGGVIPRSPPAARHKPSFVGKRHLAAVPVSPHARFSLIVAMSLFPALLVLCLCLVGLSRSAPGANDRRQSYGSCKVRPGDAGWPSKDAWAKFNESVGGHMFIPTPLASECYDLYPAGAVAPVINCSAITAAWSDTSLHAQDPTSMVAPNWELDGCVPPNLLNGSGTAPHCETNVFPRYVVAALDAEIISTTVKFAAETGVRIVIHGTGHDYMGRSNAPDSLSIWTHYLKNLTLHETFAQKNCPKGKGGPAVTMGAGYRWGEVYRYVWDRNLTVAGGSDKDVGIIGWMTGGGHSPISSKYGLGVDNVLEMEIVTPTGEIVTANECENTDLFWAMRGGGGGTFGIITSMTMTVVPDEPHAVVNILFTSTPSEVHQNNNSNWYEAAAYFSSQLPALSEAGLAGYHQYSPSIYADWGNGAPQGANDTGELTVSASFYGLSVSVEAANKAIAPIRAYLDKVSNGTLIKNITVRANPSFNNYHDTVFNPLVGGYNLVLVSRLWDKRAMEDKAAQKAVLRTIMDAGNGGLQGLLVSGPAVRRGDPDSSATHPAWRTTYTQNSCSCTWALGGSKEVAARARSLAQDVLQPALTKVAPNMGVYLNENSPYNPQWQTDFWGAHYPRLLKIKAEADPEGVLWCSVCVGSESWALDAGGKLCRT